jgi:hypothetical protein
MFAMASNKATTADLLNLPVEILDQITDYLNEEVLATLRLTCKTLHAATFDRFCNVYIAHLACWMISKDRWECLHNLLSASSKPLSDRVRTITLTMNELELRTADNFASVCGFPRFRHWAADHSREHSGTGQRRELHMEQYYHTECTMRMEAAAVEHRGAADLAVMVRVLEQAKVRKCFIRLELAPADPLNRKQPPLHPRAKEVQIHLQHAIAQAKPQIESIRLDRLRHRCLEEMLVGRVDELREPFASLREFTLTPLMGDYKRRQKDKRFEVAKAILAGAHHLQKLYLHVCSSLIGGGHERARYWASDVLLSNKLEKLESLTLLYVPLLLEDLLEILRRCSSTLTYLELRLDPKTQAGEAWVKIWEQLASMERLHHLKLWRPDSWCQMWRHERIIHPGFVETTDRKKDFVNRGEVTRGLARIIEAELSREQVSMS